MPDLPVREGAHVQARDAGPLTGRLSEAPTPPCR